MSIRSRTDVRALPSSEAALKQIAERKRSFYQRQEVAAGYDQQRFGGASGHYVNRRELAIVGALLPASGLTADVACGTGRVSEVLKARGHRVIGLDSSYPMLQLDQRSGADLSVQADAFSLPLRSGACDAAVALRLLFHFPDVTPLLREIRRVVRPGGVLVCDTYSWSPRAFLPLASRRWGAGVSRISPARFRLLAEAAGWQVEQKVSAFFVSPYLYRLLPLRLVRTLELIERHSPNRLLCRVFWRLSATTDKAVALAALAAAG